MSNRKIKIIVIINYSRSGGTLLTRILGMLPNVIIGSEINPLAGATPDHKAIQPHLALKKQMKLWYDIEVDGNSFEECVQNLAEYCNLAGSHLVIRDWTHVDFIKRKENEYKPKYNFNILEQLNSIGNLKAFVFVRDAIDVYLSSSKQINEFSMAYLIYVKKILEEQFPIFKYEDLIENPDDTVKKICDLIGIEYSPDYKRFNENLKCTGDIQLGKRSRGLYKGGIVKLPRKWVACSSRKKIDACKNLIEANSLLGYPTSYSLAKLESFGQMIVRKMRSKISW